MRKLCRHDNHDLSSTGKGRTTTSVEITKLYHRFTVQNSTRIKETLFLPAHETEKLDGKRAVRALSINSLPLCVGLRFRL